ncbi:hypothetical protein [Inquilinus sp. CAU 1745]|uniref:hypothetical protein n=1 Tax=Inquilinus sp. CAU 1745 TaxID=3140369 RepID=UPI00325C0CA5
MPDLIRHPCAVRHLHGRRFFFAGGAAQTAYGFRIKSEMTNKNNVMLDLIQHPCAAGRERPSCRRPIKGLNSFDRTANGDGNDDE